MTRPTFLALLAWALVVAAAVGIPTLDRAELTRRFEEARATGQRPPAPPAVSGETRPMQERGRL